MLKIVVNKKTTNVILIFILLIVGIIFVLSSSASLDIGPVKITPETAYTNNTLDCGFNASWGWVNQTIKANVTWFRDTGGAGFAGFTSDDENEIALTNNTYANTSATGDIESADTLKNYVFRCQVTVYDNETNTNTLNSSNLTIQNFAPVINSTIINNTSPYTNDPINCSVTAIDADPDTFTFYYKWYNSSITNGTVFTSSVLTLTAPNLHRDNTVGCLVLVSDGTTNSSWFTSTTNATIANTAPTINSAELNTTTIYTNTPINCTLDFSDIDSEDTLTRYYKFYSNNVQIGPIWENNATILTTYPGFDEENMIGCAGIVGDSTANATNWIASTTNVTIASVSIPSPGEGGTKIISELAKFGETIKINKDTKIFFKVKEKQHTLKVDNINSVLETVTITIYSSPFTVTLKVGETHLIDTDNNGLSDLSITLNRIESRKAILVLKEIEEVKKEEPSIEKVSKKIEGEITPELITFTPAPKKRLKQILLITLVVCIFVFAYLMIRLKKPRFKSKNRFNNLKINKLFNKIKNLSKKVLLKILVIFVDVFIFLIKKTKRAGYILKNKFKRRKSK